MGKFLLLFCLSIEVNLFCQVFPSGLQRSDNYKDYNYRKAAPITYIASADKQSISDIRRVIYPDFQAYLPKIKYEFGSVECLSIGLSTIDYEGDDVVAMPLWKYNGPFVETGIAFKDHTKYMCNKVGYEYFLLFLGGRVNLVHYTDFTLNQYYFRPEVGVSLFSFITFTYGYNFNIYTGIKANMNGSIFSLNIARFINKKEYRKNE